MKIYQHTQPGTYIAVAMLAGAVLLATIGCALVWQGTIGIPFLLLSAWLFHSLTIEIADGKLRWHYGSGIISKQVRLTDIANIKIVRTSFIEGWGIHYSRYGWLYNVAGCDAVAVTLRNGKRFALGTDEPTVLLQAINTAIGAQS